MPVPLDEYPIHQGPETMKYFVTSDRNVYDRCIMHALDRPDGGTAGGRARRLPPRRGRSTATSPSAGAGSLTSLRTSGALGDDRMPSEVGPMRVEVVEGLRTVRFVCDGAGERRRDRPHLGGAFPAIDEPRHIRRQGDTTILDAFRFVQTADVTGTVAHRRRARSRPRPTGSGPATARGASGPSARAPPAGRPHGEPAMWWCWIPLRFDDFALMFVLEEDPDGYRTINQAVRIWPDGRVEQLGWAEPRDRVPPGYPLPDPGPHRAARSAAAASLELDIEPLGPMPLSVGLGYGPDDDGWNHGRWMGEEWTPARRPRPRRRRPSHSGWPGA